MTAPRPQPRPAKRVMVLMGGNSSERAVSLVSGEAVAKSLAASGYAVSTFDPAKGVAALLRALDPAPAPAPDVVFNALHGRFGEDGCIQGLLELVGIPYTHSGVLASALAMNKPAAKRMLETVGVRSPAGAIVSRAELLQGHPMAPPYVVKPIAEGSTVGVEVIRAGDNRTRLPEQWSYGEAVLVETYIPGRELTVGVMGERALAVTEIRFTSSVFDYEAKYTPGRAEHIIPAPVPRAIYDEAMRVALLAHRTLGCRGISRSDLRYDATRPVGENLFFLEINTQPGFTPISLVPEQAKHLGISFAELAGWLVESATCEPRPASVGGG